MEDMQLSKIDVAKRQLTTAIRLFYANADPVSVCSLACNAWEIVDSLCRRNDIGSLSIETEKRLPDDGSLRHQINNPVRNFFKHADRDPDEMLSGFDDAFNDTMLILGVEDYIRLRNKSPIEFQVYQMWYFANYPDKLSKSFADCYIQDVQESFPSILSLPRKRRKKMGLEVLKKAIMDPQILHHPETEHENVPENTWFVQLVFE